MWSRPRPRRSGGGFAWFGLFKEVGVAAPSSLLNSLYAGLNGDGPELGRPSFLPRGRARRLAHRGGARPRLQPADGGPPHRRAGGELRRGAPRDPRRPLRRDGGGAAGPRARPARPARGGPPIPRATPPQPAPPPRP